MMANADSKAAEALAARLPGSVRVQLPELASALLQITSSIHIVCLWEAKATDSPAATAQRVALEGLEVVQALKGRHSSRLWWVTSCAVAVQDNEPVSVETSTVWGLGRTVMQDEFENTFDYLGDGSANYVP